MAAGSPDSTTITPGYRGGVLLVFPREDYIYRLQMYHVNGSRGDSVALAVSRACIIEQLTCVFVLRIRCVVDSTAVNDVAAHVPKARCYLEYKGSGKKREFCWKMRLIMLPQAF